MMRPLATSYWLLAGGIHEFKIQDKGRWPLAARSQLLEARSQQPAASSLLSINHAHGLF